MSRTLGRIPCPWALGATLCAALSVGATPAPSEPVALHAVRAPGAEACLAPYELARRVETLTGPRFVAASASKVSLEVWLARDANGYFAQLTRSDARGRSEPRTLRAPSPDCADLTPTLVFVVALMVDPALSSSALPPEVLAALTEALPDDDTLLAAAAAPEPAPAPTPPPAREPAQPAAVPAPAPLGETRFALELGMLARSLGLSTWLVGAALGAELPVPRFAPLRLELYAAGAPARWMLPLDLRQLTAVAVDVGLCPLRLRRGALRVHGCAGLGAGWLLGAGSGFAENRRARLMDTGLTAELGVAYQFSRHFGLAFALGARVRLSRGRFSAEDRSGETDRYTPPLLDGIARLGPRFEF
jgi:hypothetical protein